MAVTCIFLEWKRSALEAAAAYLLDRYEVDGLVDLTHVTIVLPTRRAGRRLREVLLDGAEQRQHAIFPPNITTVGAFPEMLYECKRPFASPLIQQLAWADALKKLAPASIKKIIPQPPKSRHDPRWWELGALLQRQHLELADHRLDFAGVAQLGNTVEGFTDTNRWQALAKVQQAYLKTLDDLELWDRQTARNFAIEKQECEFGGDVILLGTVDLSRTLRAMLDQIADRVTALVYADRAFADRFDSHGCVIPEAWQSASLSVEEHQILVADGPANQADAVVHAIAGFRGKYAAEDFTIGVPDASLVPHLENKLQQFQLKVRWGPGRSLAASRPAQWLRIVADYLSSSRYETLAELVRHSDTHLYLMGLDYSRDVIRELDRYFEKHLPDTIRASRDTPGDLPDGVLLLLNLLKSLKGKEKTPPEWGEAIHDVLLRLYLKRQLNVEHDGDRATIQACDQIRSAIDRFAELPASITPRMSASAVILLLLSQFEDEEVAPPNTKDAIEMVGWLDLPLDDAKVAIVTSMNDGIVPRTVSSDVFLPNALRQALGLDDNAQRYARDAYALQVLLNSRMAVRLITGRRQATNDPLRPSRLLLALPHDKLSNRCLRLFDSNVDCAPVAMPVATEDLMFQVPPPKLDIGHPVESLSVSDFGSYLTCPYRFYLRKVMRLRAKDDRLTELDAPTFGNVAHAVLDLFGKSEFSDSANADEIRLYLMEQLGALANELFGRHPKPTIQVQVAQMRLRLTAFADRQAAWREEGWRIIHSEFAEDDGQLLIDDKPMRLKGRIDRIDHRIVDDAHEFAVLDYKTGDKGDTPDKKHLPERKKNAPIVAELWSDLQLPLYVHLLKHIPQINDVSVRRIRLGYILLPSTPSEAKFALANWTDEDLATANEAVASVVRSIRNGQFWPPADPYPYAANDEFAAIMQDRIFGRERFTREAIGV